MFYCSLSINCYEWRKNASLIFSWISEVDASEILENIEEMFRRESVMNNRLDRILTSAFPVCKELNYVAYYNMFTRVISSKGAI